MRDWTGAGQPAPLILTEREWRESADAFPIEYEDIRDAHRLLAGRDPWPGILIDRGHLRRQLEHELMGKLVRLRQAYAALHEDPKQLARVVVGSAGGFFTMLRAVLRLASRPVPALPADLVRSARSEEHTSELQSPCNLVCRLLLEKKKDTSRPQAESVD